MRRIRSALWLLALLASVQCSDVNAPSHPNEIGQEVVGPPLLGLIVSGPAVADNIAASASNEGGVTYVSLPPATQPLATGVEISNVTQHEPPVRIAVVDGGFDPVPIQASAGDRLEVAVFGPGGITAVYAATVPKRRPPTIVRTNPPRGRTDVAIKVLPTVVFSEPIDAATLNIASLQLLENGARVPGTVELSPSSSWVAAFTPAAPLKPGTAYQLVVTQDVRDLEGDALDVPIVVEFTTAGSTVGGNLAGRLAFVTMNYPLGERLYLASADGSSVIRLAETAGWFSRPRWSPDGSRLVLARTEINGASSIYVVDVDGGPNWTRVGYGIEPGWSPDGTRIVYGSTGVPWTGLSLHVMNADGSGVRRLTAANDPAQCSVGASASDNVPDWSPDGRTIIFERRFHTSEEGGFDCGLDGWGYRPHLFVVNADGSGLRQFLSSGSQMDPAWSPDGQLIAYTIECCTLSIIDSEGAGPARQPYGAGRQFSPTWSPDGKHLLFRSQTPTSEGLFILDVASGSVRPHNIPGVTGIIRDVSWGRPVP